MSFIHDCLSTLKPLEPIPTGMAVRISSLPPPRAILFDIYGTLLISSAGDLNAAMHHTQAFIDACTFAGITLANPAKTAADFVQNIVTKIAQYHAQKKADGIQYPEIIIEEIVLPLLHTYEKGGQLILPNNSESVYRLLYSYETSINPVWPMPHLQPVIGAIQLQDIKLGLLSNAQFYTPTTLSFFLNDHVDEGNLDLSPFNDDLTFFSYRMQRGKPDPTLFSAATSCLKLHYRIEPHETLFIGNDMVKDIIPAKNAGMQTALFAGDKRSLRLEKNDVNNTAPEADYVITSLVQILDIITKNSATNLER